MDASNRTDPNALLARLLDEVDPPKVGPPDSDSIPPQATEEVRPTADIHAIRSDSPPAEASGSPAGGASPLIGNLLSNPALLSALPTLLENLSPLLAGGAQSSEGGGQSPTTRPTASVSHRLPVDRHTALLCAIKPYLSAERQSAAETMIRLCRVWDALGRSGISLSGLLGTLGGGTTVSSASPTDGNASGGTST